MNVITGIVGALLGEWLLSGPFGTSTINEGEFSIGGVLVFVPRRLAPMKLVRGTATR
jgi:uncharacterized membrane protein YeaQ/YmgE (transglycosylase-associated protein family)